MVIDDTTESDIDKILSTPATRNLPMLTSTPSRSQSMKKATDWKSLSPAEQLEILHEVANTHTKVSLDFEGLRRSIVAAQKASALQVGWSFICVLSTLRDGPSLGLVSIAGSHVKKSSRVRISLKF